MILAAALRLMTLDPGHFHAALVQKEMLPELSPEVAVYAPLGPDLTAHLQRVALFHAPWKLRIYAAPDFFERMLAERPGDFVVLSGNNRGKIERVNAIAAARLHALVDKPWIIEPGDLPKLQTALDTAERHRVVAYDAMTQRYEIAYQVQKGLVNDRAVFGEPVSVHMESVHALLKLVAGAPNLRPPWFFDIRQQGEGLTDVGTHLVDLVHWTLFEGQPLDYRRDIAIADASRWPTLLDLAKFQRVTGLREFPGYLTTRDGSLPYYCNNSVRYKIRGVDVRLDVKWDFEGADTELAVYRGTKATVEMRQGEVYLTPKGGEPRAIPIPKEKRVGHEAHFALLLAKFLGYVRNPGSLAAWEKPHMLAKYYVTTEGVALARKKERRP